MVLGTANAQPSEGKGRGGVGFSYFFPVTNTARLSLTGVELSS